MKFPLNPEDLKEEIYISIDKKYYTNSLRYNQLKKILTKVNDDIILEGVLRVLEDISRGNKSYEEQSFAGNLLYEIKPKANIPLDKILERVLKNYNLSVAELPFYLKEQFGLDELRKCLDNINSSCLDNDILLSIKTFNYWIRE